MDDNERFRRHRAERAWRLEVEDLGLDLSESTPEVDAAVLRLHHIRSGLVTPADHDEYNRRTDATWEAHCTEQRAKGWDPAGDLARLRLLESIESTNERARAELVGLRRRLGRVA
jgi:hypothetical protein